MADATATQLPPGGPWWGTLESAIQVVDEALGGAPEEERARLAQFVHEAAATRWCTLASLPKGALPVKLGDDSYAWPGDLAALTLPISGAIDIVPWRVRASTEGLVVIMREEPKQLIFSENRCVVVRYDEQSAPAFRRWLPN